MKENCLVLGIETSCDETSAAVVADGKELLSNVISSQMELHRRFGGVVPEVASRRHVERMTAIIQEALDQAGVRLDDLSAVAVTQGPGLVGALLIGVSAAKALSFATGSFTASLTCSTSVEAIDMKNTRSTRRISIIGAI